MPRHETPAKSRTLWIDTDVGFDDLVAIASLECRPDIQISQITTVGGIQPDPMESASFLQTEFRTTFVTPGLVPLLVQENESTPSWLQSTRQKLRSLHSKSSIEKSPLGSRLNTNDGRNQLTRFLTSQEDRSVDLLCLGPLTNIAYCLDDNSILQDLMDAKLRQVWVMGGNNPYLSSVPEFNFATDPQATATVLEVLQDRISILPVQTCQKNGDVTIQTTWDRLVNLATSSESSDKGNSILQLVFRKNPEFSSLKYDAICAFAYYRPAKVTTEQIRTRVDSSSGLIELAAEEEHQGQVLSRTFHWMAKAGSSNGYMKQ